MAAARLMSCTRTLCRLSKGSGSILQTRCISSGPSFKFQDLDVELTTSPTPKPDWDNLVFGKHFSDHMLEVPWDSSSGWGKPKICPVHPLQMHPGAKCLHYAIELFEGMKSYRGEDGTVRMFRPEVNMHRMNMSAERATLPTFDGEELIKCIKQLIQLDREWVPESQKSSLYIRPTMIGTEPSLGVMASSQALLFVLTGPVGPYYPTGFKPISLLADPSNVRAWEGGVGWCKLGSNYGPTIAVQMEAQKRGCQQVLWLYGDDHQLTEVGTMNIFMYWTNEKGEEELVTPPLGKGIILPGVTRRSLLDLAIEWGEFKVAEHPITMKDIIKGLKENRVKEMFGAGTACVVSPIEKIVYHDHDLHIPTMDDGAPMVHRFLSELTDIQYGRKPSSWAPSIDDM